MENTKTEKLKAVNEKTMIVAIDIGKTVHYGYLRGLDGQDVKPFPFYNFQKSFKEFWAKVLNFKQQKSIEEVVIGFESTGPYAEPLLNSLAKKSERLVQVNSMHTKYFIS
jgi:RNase H-fold protein (predicted Holliday junction resolvase)